MGHNKMYREIEGYEDALYQTNDTIDLLDHLYGLIQCGNSRDEINEVVNKIEYSINQIKNQINMNN